jgi:hypothetical protein
MAPGLMLMICGSQSKTIRQSAAADVNVAASQISSLVGDSVPHCSAARLGHLFQ